jgi:hypothetical protein
MNFIKNMLVATKRHFRRASSSGGEPSTIVNGLLVSKGPSDPLRSEVPLNCTSNIAKTAARYFRKPLAMVSLASVWTAASAFPFSIHLRHSSTRKSDAPPTQARKFNSFPSNLLLAQSYISPCRALDHNSRPGRWRHRHLSESGPKHCEEKPSRKLMNTEIPLLPTGGSLHRGILSISFNQIRNFQTSHRRGVVRKDGSNPWVVRQNHGCQSLLIDPWRQEAVVKS